jgi:hypothetical protein
MTQIEASPLSLYFVGSALDGEPPIAWQMSDYRPNRGAGTVTFLSMSIVERAALRALCGAMLKRLDATEAAEADS